MRQINVPIAFGDRIIAMCSTTTRDGWLPIGLVFLGLIVPLGHGVVAALQDDYYTGARLVGVLSDTIKIFGVFGPLVMAAVYTTCRVKRVEVKALRFPCRRKSGIWYNVWMDEALLIHPTHWMCWRQDRYLDAVLLASSLSKSAVKTCFAFPTCGTALAWSTLPGFPTTIIATIPMP